GLVTCCIVLAGAPFFTFGSYLFEGLAGHPHVELILVMLVGPVIMNSFQFWVNDNILMSDKFKRKVWGYERIDDGRGGIGVGVGVEGVGEEDAFADMGVDAGPGDISITM
ncbi:hypothetical protein TeGR_g3327, partial [Tetraparma gracilis]